MDIFLFILLVLHSIALSSAAPTVLDDSGNEQADDPSDDWCDRGSTETLIKVKVTTEVRVVATKTVLPATEWNTIQPGQTLLVRNWPCRVTDISSQDSPVSSNSDDVNLNDDSVNVKVDVKVDVTSFQIGAARCLVQPRRKMFPRTSCTSSAQCQDSGSVCKIVQGQLADASDAPDYVDQLNDAEDLGDVSADPMDNSSSVNSDPEAAADDLSDWINPCTCQGAIALRPTVDVRIFASRLPLSPPDWATMAIGETLLVRNRPCLVVQNDQPNLLDDPGNATEQSDHIDINQNIKVDVNSILGLGPLRCRVQPQPVKQRVTGNGWCACDSNLRFACKTDIECTQRFGSEDLYCAPTFACPVKGRTGYCRRREPVSVGTGLIGTTGMRFQGSQWQTSFSGFQRQQFVGGFAGSNAFSSGINSVMPGFNPKMGGFGPPVPNFGRPMGGFNPMMGGFNPMMGGPGIFLDESSSSQNKSA